jgi:5S rRNA maturation endonuclease (ribonuclease M5)
MVAQNFLLKKRKMNKSISIDQNKIKVLCDRICDRIEDLLDHFHLDYKDNGRFMTMNCPIHGGDNDTALNLYYTGDTYRGNWKCRTHHCEEVFKGSIIGFIRGLLSRQNYAWTKNGDSTCSFNEAVDFATQFLNLSLKDIKISTTEKDNNSFIAQSKLLTKPVENDIPQIKRSTVRNNLRIPSQYFLNRGFSADVLDKYDVGDCISNNKEMSNRAVVPIYDIDYTSMIGCSGRSIYSQCNQCKSYHESSDKCPSSDIVWKMSKWKHSAGFKTQDSLYNFWFAKEFIKDSGSAIIVESPGNVWRLEENNIHNAVGIFGSNLNDRQKTLLDMSGAMSLILIMDNDEAGEKARKQIYDKCHRTYNILNIRITKNDIADMTPEEINNQIRTHL